MATDSRVFLVNWLKSLDVDITKVEDIGKGVALCALMTKLDPSFPRFRESPTTQMEYLDNLKLIYHYMTNKGIKLFFPMERMIELRFQDNLEVLQWFYKYYLREKEAQENVAGVGYDSVHESNKEHNHVCTHVRSKEKTSRDYSDESLDILMNTPIISTVAKSPEDPGSTIKKAVPQNPEDPGSTIKKTLPDCDELTLGIKNISLSSNKQEEIDTLKAKYEKLKDFALAFQSLRNKYFDKLLEIQFIVNDSENSMDADVRAKLISILEKLN